MTYLLFLTRDMTLDLSGESVLLVSFKHDPSEIIKKIKGFVMLSWGSKGNIGKEKG